MAFTKEQAVELGISFETETPTPEEIESKVLAKLTESTGEIAKLKNSISKVNSENAEYKRKEQARMSEDEKKAAHEKELEEKLAGYEKQFAKTNKVNDYLSIGYPKDLAEEIADAELAGKNTATLHQKYIKSREEALKKELMVQNPKPKTGDPDDHKDLTQEGYNKLTYSEKLKLKETNPTLFEKYHNKK